LILSGPVATPDSKPLDGVPQGLLALAIVVSIAWTVAISVITLAEVQRFAIWKTLATVLIASIPAFIIDVLR
jgi:hypothetical protein